MTVTETDIVERAIQSIDREQFISSNRDGSIVGHSIPTADIANKILSGLDVLPAKKILQIGVGSGYMPALLSQCAEKVFCIEKIPSLATVAWQNFEKLNLSNIILFNLDGRQFPVEPGPYDAIVISTPTIKDKTSLLNELSKNGQLICLEYSENNLLVLVRYQRTELNNFSRTELGLIDFSKSKSDTLVELGLATNEQLQDAKIHAKNNKTLIIDELRKLLQISDIDLYRSIAGNSGLNLLGNVEHLLKVIQPELFNSCSRAFLDHNHMIPLYIENNSLKLATYDPDASLDDIQQMFPEYKIQKILVTPTDFHRLWSAIDLSHDSRHHFEQIDDTNNDLDLLNKTQTELESHLVTLFEALLLDAVAEKASDIHLELYGDRVRVRLRVDGELHDVPYYNLSPQELKGLINVVKLRSDLNIAERRLPQGGRSGVKVGDALFDLRIQLQPALHGEHLIIRLLPQNTETITIEQLGFSPHLAEHYRRLLNNPAGMVLVVGPTGSGKSTTLYSGLQLLADDGRRKVITIEDPVEYSIDNIQQVNVRPEINFNFADAMRAFVREDPDVILVGEIRDKETALEAIRASQTGHVVLSTLHCNDAVDALQRLFDLGIQANSLASELLAVIAQRLAKKICPHCKKPAQADPEILRELFPEGAPNNFQCFTGRGCSHCNGKGTRGRIAVVEYMQVNPDIRNAISMQPPIGKLRALALDNGLISMRDSALDHVIQGHIPLSELPRILSAERMAPEVRGQLESPL